jgi:DNA-binding HxlR family transcriptional regulator
MKREQSLFSEKCPMHLAIDMIGGKWKIPILWVLSEKGTLRFGQLKHEVHGITNTMLSSTLKELGEDNLVSRKVLDTVPPQVEYSLTKKAGELVPILEDMANWGASNA